MTTTRKAAKRQRGFATPKVRPELSDQAVQISQAARPQTPSRRLLLTTLKILARHLLPVTAILIVPGSLVQIGGLMTAGADPSIIANQGPSRSETIGFGLQGIGALGLLFATSAYLYLQLRAIGGARPGIIESYRRSIGFLPRLFGLYAFIGILTIVGLFLLIVPGFLVLRRYYLSPYFMMDENLGIRESLQRSAAAVKTSRRPVWTTLGLLILLTSVSTMLSQYLHAFGIFISVPLTAIAGFLPALRYQELSSDIRNGERALGSGAVTTREN